MIKFYFNDEFKANISIMYIGFMSLISWNTILASIDILEIKV